MVPFLMNKNISAVIRIYCKTWLTFASTMQMHHIQNALLL